MGALRITTDHEEIKRWAESHGATPAMVHGSGGLGDPGILRLALPDAGDLPRLDELTWEAFFDTFDEEELAFTYPAGDGKSTYRLVRRASTTGTSANQPHARRMDAVTLLEHQHREIEALFEHYENLDDGDEQGRTELFEAIGDALAAHAAIEERIFYPAILEDATEDELREAVEEHLAMKRVIVDLLELDAADAQFDAKMKVLGELVDHHVHEEEDELFEMLEDLHQDDRLELGVRMQARYDELIGNDPRFDLAKEVEQAAER